LNQYLRIGTFNLMNLALPGYEYYRGESYTPAIWEKKLTWTAGLLTQMNADFFGFQEVFQKEALLKVLDKTGIYKGAEVFVAEENGRMPRVAFASRLPVLDVQIIKEFPEKAIISVAGIKVPYNHFQRPVIKARVCLPGGSQAIVLVVHLKSKRPMIEEGAFRHDPWEVAFGQTKSLILRSCEVAALRWIILQEIQQSDRPLILLGDLNDSTHAVTSDILQGDQPQRNYPQDVKKKLWDILLYSCADIQVRRSFKDVYYTHLHNSHYESLDHILVSQEFVNENPKHVATVEYMRLYNDHLLDPALTEEKPEPWISDHGAALASFKMRI
jgi:endonuclease/exonuclease/phosphatase family metal-dependent hydrolase